MKFQPTPSAYAPVDPFKPSLSFSIGKITGSQRDDADLDSPPPRRAAVSRRYSAFLPSTKARKEEASPDGWRLPPTQGIRPPPPPSNWIPPAPSSPIILPRPIEFYFPPGSPSSSASPARGRRRSPCPPLIVRNSSPRRKRNFKELHSRSRTRSPERNRQRSPYQRRSRSRGRSRSPISSRRRGSSRSSRPSSRSATRVPMVMMREDTPPIDTVPPLAAPELPPPRSSSQSIQPISSSSSSRSRSARYRSRTPPPHPIQPPESPPSPIPTSLSSDSGEARYVAPPRPGPIFPTPYVPSIHSIPIVMPGQRYEPQCSSAHEYPLASDSEKSDPSFSDETQSVGFWDRSSESIPAMTYVAAFVFDTLPRQLYLYFLLRLPYMYFSRVTRIFEEAEMSMPQIKQGILEAAVQLKEPVMGVADAWRLEPVESVQYSKLQNTWQSFIDSLLREWKTLNIISVLLLSAILTILQIEGAANDPYIRYSALLSMICALMSLFYGCIYIIRFGTMRKTYKAAEWAQEAQTSRTGIFWNVWVLLAMPATWLAWSMIMYIFCIMSFVWRTGTTEDAERGTMTPEDALAFRIIVSVVLALGLIYFVLIASTLRRYGEMMDQAWHRRIVGWVNDTVAPTLYNTVGSVRMPPTPVPVVDKKYKYQPKAGSDFGPTLNLYTRDMQYPTSKPPTIHSKSVASARSHITQAASRSSLRLSEEFRKRKSREWFREHDYGTDKNRDVIFSQSASKDEIRSRDMKIPSDLPQPPPPLSSVSAPTPAHPLNLLEPIPDEAQQERVVGPDQSEEPIKATRVLSLSFEGDHPFDDPPSEDDLQSCYMTKELWEELQTDAQRVWSPSLPEDMARTLYEWNHRIFFRHGAQIALCNAFTDTQPPRFGLYFFSSAKVLPSAEGNNYAPLPEGIRRLDIHDYSHVIG